MPFTLTMKYNNVPIYCSTNYFCYLNMGAMMLAQPLWRINQNLIVLYWWFEQQKFMTFQITFFFFKHKDKDQP
jgi:hypothetical protein